MFSILFSHLVVARFVPSMNPESCVQGKFVHDKIAREEATEAQTTSSYAGKNSFSDFFLRLFPIAQLGAGRNGGTRPQLNQESAMYTKVLSHNYIAMLFTRIKFLTQHTNLHHNFLSSTPFTFQPVAHGHNFHSSVNSSFRAFLNAVST